jgi:hypothetical protein
MRQRLGPTLPGLLVAAAAVGCASPNPRFFYGHAPHNPQGFARPSGTVAARGTITGRQVSLRYSYEGAQPPHLHYGMDQYVAKTYDGRTLPLEKGPLVDYPDTSDFGSASTVALRLPKGVAAHELTHILASIEYGQTVIDLTPLSAPAQEPINALSPMIGPGLSVGAARPAWPEAIRAMAPPGGSATALAPAAPGALPISPAVAGPPGSVPVEVEFAQDLGSTLSAEVRWNAEKDSVVLSAGGRQVFFLMPGQHELRFSCRVPFIAKTDGRVPIYVLPEKPMRLVLTATARLSGAEVRLRAYQGTTLVGERTFTPNLAAALSDP